MMPVPATEIGGTAAAQPAPRQMNRFSSPALSLAEKAEFVMFKIFVGNLAQGVTDEDVRHLFERHAQIDDIALPVDEKGRLRGFAIVMIKDPQQGRLALMAARGSRLQGRMLIINQARKKGKAPPKRGSRRASFRARGSGSFGGGGGRPGEGGGGRPYRSGGPPMGPGSFGSPGSSPGPSRPQGDRGPRPGNGRPGGDRRPPERGQRDRF